MKTAHVIAAMIWVSGIILLVKPSSALEVSREKLLNLGDYPVETFELGSDTKGYSQFLVKLRNRLSATKACDMPVTRENLPAGGEYVLVDLKINKDEYVTLAIQVNNVYLVAYRVGGRTQGTFLNEPNVDSARDKLFDKSQNQPTLRYDSNYDNIEKFGGSRKDLALGLQELKKKIEAFYDTNKPVTPADEAKFILTAIQMVSEAARFKYIENLVVKGGTTKSFKPDAEMIDFETNWGKISKEVHQSNEQIPNQCISVNPPIVIGSKTLILVSDIKKDVSLLMYKKIKANGHHSFSQVVKSSINDATDIATDVGDLAIAFKEDSVM